MPKKENLTEVDKECPLCGGLIWKSVKVVIEGVKMSVCQSCSQGVEVVREKKVKRTYLAQKPPIRPQYSQKSKKATLLEPTEELVPDFNTRIRKKRSQLRLTQEEFSQKLNEKPSLIRRIETGKARPTIKLAKKIESVYGIKLLEKSSEINDTLVNTKYLKKKSSGTSLGDIAFIKKRDK